MPESLSDAKASSVQLPSPFNELVQGKIPAVQIPPIDGEAMDPVQQFAVENLADLLAKGLDYHETADQRTVFFNPKKVTEKQVADAEKDGTLDKIAPVAAAPAPQQEAQQPDASANAAPAAPLAAAQAIAAPAPNRQLQSARILNARPAAPLAPNPVPGQLAKRAI